MTVYWHPTVHSIGRALAAIVFKDDAQRAKLNAIVHPLIGARTARMLADAAPDAIVLHDVPLLVENGLAPAYHLVIVVDAPVDERVRRLVSSRGMAEDGRTGPDRHPDE